MIDAFGKESPFHLEFIRLAEALIAILKVNFKSTGSGTRMIERGDFVMEDDGTKRDIDLAGDWETCFFPGQRVSMSIVLERIQDRATSICPGCGNESGSAADREVIWCVLLINISCLDPSKSRDSETGPKLTRS
jgi:hypothetical protein